MSKLFQGQVAIILNTKGEIALRKDHEGKFSAADAAEIYEALQRLSKAHKAPISKYSLFTPKGGTVPVLLANRFGQPYLALIAPNGQQLTASPKRAVKRLA